MITVTLVCTAVTTAAKAGRYQIARLVARILVRIQI